MTIGKREGKFKQALRDRIKVALPAFYVLSHVDATNGIPDLSISGNGTTTWWEFKHGTPDFTSRGVQVMTCRKLAAASFCRFVVFWENGAGEKRTYILHPSQVVFGRNSDTILSVDCYTEGFDYDWLIDQIKRAHGL